MGLELKDRDRRSSISESCLLISEGQVMSKYSDFYTRDQSVSGNINQFGVSLPSLRVR